MEINVSKVIFADSIKELDKKSKEIMEKQIFKVGDRVYHIQHGWGEVEVDDFYYGINKKTYNIHVRFLDNNVSFTFDGKEFEEEKHSTLSFTEYTLQGFSQERPIELPEVGELCLVRDSNISVWQLVEFRGYDPSQLYCFKTDLGYWGEMKRIKILD